MVYKECAPNRYSNIRRALNLPTNRKHDFEQKTAQVINQMSVTGVANDNKDAHVPTYCLEAAIITMKNQVSCQEKLVGI